MLAIIADNWNKIIKLDEPNKETIKIIIDFEKIEKVYQRKLITNLRNCEKLNQRYRKKVILNLELGKLCLNKFEENSEQTQP